MFSRAGWALPLCVCPALFFHLRVSQSVSLRAARTVFSLGVSHKILLRITCSSRDQLSANHRRQFNSCLVLNSTQKCLSEKAPPPPPLSTPQRALKRRDCETNASIWARVTRTCQNWTMYAFYTRVCRVQKCQITMTTSCAEFSPIRAQGLTSNQKRSETFFYFFNFKLFGWGGVTTLKPIPVRRIAEKQKNLWRIYIELWKAQLCTGKNRRLNMKFGCSCPRTQDALFPQGGNTEQHTSCDRPTPERDCWSNHVMPPGGRWRRLSWAGHSADTQRVHSSGWRDLELVKGWGERRGDFCWIPVRWVVWPCFRGNAVGFQSTCCTTHCIHSKSKKSLMGWRRQHWEPPRATDPWSAWQSPWLPRETAWHLVVAKKLRCWHMYLHSDPVYP